MRTAAGHGDPPEFGLKARCCKGQWRRKINSSDRIRNDENEREFAHFGRVGERRRRIEIKKKKRWG